MLDLPKIGNKLTYIGTHIFWYKNYIENAEKELFIGHKYTLSEISVASSWVKIKLQEKPDMYFPLNFFKRD